MRSDLSSPLSVIMHTASATSSDFSCIMVPLQSSLTVTLPVGHGTSTDHNPFPGIQPTIAKFEDKVNWGLDVKLTSYIYISAFACTKHSLGKQVHSSYATTLCILIPSLVNL